MREFLKQFSGLIGAGVAAACCLGLPVVLAAMGAVGLGFIVHDAYLFPIFVGFLALSTGLLWRSTRARGRRAPLALGAAGALVAAAGMWLLVTAIYPHAFPVYVGLALVLAASLWDLIDARRRGAACAADAACAPDAAPRDPGRRAVTGAALSLAAAGAFYGLYRSVEAFAPPAAAGKIACYGINSCKGTTACSTAFNACRGQNQCKGKGYEYATPKECALEGGVPLKDSPANPARG